MKLVISKNKEGNGYYTKITNEYMNEKSEMYLSLQLGKNVGELEYGLYEVDGFLSCYKGKDGSVKPKLIITKAIPTKKYEKTNSEIVTDAMTQESDPYAEFGEQIDITDNFLE